jgi:hypothetical protein
MGRPTTNADGKNAQHDVKVLQTKGFSKAGAQEIEAGKAPSGAADRARAKGSTDAKVQQAAGARAGAAGAKSTAEKRLEDHRKALADNWR